jgi:transcriptional regulator with XRE-family HTH domain
MTFGQIVAEARKKLGLSQKDLAARITKEDGAAISPQYLNDIERDRRNPPSEYLIGQFARELNLAPDYLYYVAGQLPQDLRGGSRREEEVRDAFVAFRRALGSDRR